MRYLMRTVVGNLRNFLSAQKSPHGTGPPVKENGSTMTPIFIQQGNGLNVQPLIRVLQHVGQQALVFKNNVHGNVPIGHPSLVFAELSPSNAEELQRLRTLHEQVPHAKIIALVDPTEPDEQAVQKCAQQPGVFRTFKDPFNAGGLLAVVDQLLPLDSD